MMNMVIKALNGASYTCTVIVGGKTSGGDQYVFSTGTAAWNPNLELVTPEGTMSLALALGHELVHAFLGWGNASSQWFRDEQYENATELKLSKIRKHLLLRFRRAH